MGLLMRPRRPLARQDAHNQPASQAYDPTQAAPPAAAPVPAAASVDETGELERLAKLHDSGSLTDAEFGAAKARVLGF